MSPNSSKQIGLCTFVIRFISGVQVCRLYSKTAFRWVSGRARTVDNRNHNPVLCQLSYRHHEKEPSSRGEEGAELTVARLYAQTPVNRSRGAFLRTAPHGIGCTPPT